MSDKWIEVSFLKMEVNPSFISGTSKISIHVSTLNQRFSIKCPRSIRNGVVNFFGQIITLPYETKSFTIIIQSIDRYNIKKELSHMPIQTLDKLTKKNISLTQENQFIKLYSTIRVASNYEVSSYHSQQKTQQDLSEIDAQIHKYMQNVKKQSLTKHRFSPEKIQQKHSFKFYDDSLVEMLKAKNFEERITDDSIRTKLFRKSSKTFIDESTLKNSKKSHQEILSQSLKTKKEVKSENNFVVAKLQAKKKVCAIKRNNSSPNQIKPKFWERYNLKGILITGLASIVLQAIILNMQD